MSRTLLLALALAAAALTRATPALAGSSCGGGHSSGGGGHSSSGGGSSGGGSSSGGSYDFSSSDSTPAAPACTDETDIVGYRHCTKFGAWANSGSHARLLILDLGLSVRTFASPLSSSTGTVTHADESFTYRVAGGAPSPSSPAQPPSETAVVSTLRVGSAKPSGFYLLAEGELGGLVRNASHVEMTSTGLHGAPSIRPDASLVTGVLGVAGVHGVVGDTTLGVEAAGGVRSITYKYESQYLSCRTSSAQTVSSPVLEVRARASRWISPFVNVGASAGASVIDRGAWVAGVHLGFATQAYGNLRD